MHIPLTSCKISHPDRSLGRQYDFKRSMAII